MTAPLRVLILEDQPSDAEIMVLELQRVGFDPDWRRVETESDYLAHLDPSLDLILADYSLPQFNGLRALQLLQARGLDIPFILVSGTIGEDLAVEAMKRGATDYLLKDRLARLGEAVRHALQEKRLRDEKQRAEEVLRESEERFRALIENSSDGIILLDADGVVLYASPATSRILGYALDALVGQNALELVHPDDVQNTAHVLADLRQKPNEIATGEFRCRHKDGSWSWIEAVGNNLLAEPSVGAIIVNYRDTTERKQAEEALERLRRQNELILNSAGEGIYGLDLEGRTTFVNPAAAKMLGWEAEELIGQPMHDILHHTKPDGSPYPREECPIYAAFRDGATHRVMHEVFWKKDGTSFPVAYVSTPIREKNEIVGAVVVFEDITQRKRMEEAEREQRILAEALRDTAAALNSTLNIDEVLVRLYPFEGIGKAEYAMAKILRQETCHAYSAQRISYTDSSLCANLFETHLATYSGPGHRRNSCAGQTHGHRRAADHGLEPREALSKLSSGA